MVKAKMRGASLIKSHNTKRVCALPALKGSCNVMCVLNIYKLAAGLA